MIQSMTGFGTAEKNINGFGTVSVELRSTNHKFLETVLHLPEGFLSVEDRLKKMVESSIKRGRVTCVVSLVGKTLPEVSVNRHLFLRYLKTTRELRKLSNISEEVSIDTLINLPGVISLSERKISPNRIWPGFKKAMETALKDLVSMRSREGKALSGHLKSGIEELKASSEFIKERFKKAIREKSEQLKNDVEKAVFLKESDITEETDRLTYHIKNFKNKLGVSGPIGKELDFICQEMQREANTIGAKSVDVQVSGRVVQIKSQIEKLREQAQNVE